MSVESFNVITFFFNYLALGDYLEEQCWLYISNSDLFSVANVVYTDIEVCSNNEQDLQGDSSLLIITN